MLAPRKSILNDRESKCLTYWDHNWPANLSIVTVFAEVVSRHGQRTLTLPSSGFIAEQRQTDSPLCAVWFKDSLLLMHKLPQRVGGSSVAENLPDLRFSPGGLVAAASGLLPLPFPQQREALDCHKKFPGLWYMATLWQHSKWSHLHWVTVTICFCIFSLQKVLFCPA